MIMQIPAFYFDPEFLDSVANHHAKQFAAAQPFPHWVMSDFLPKEILHLLVSEFPGPDDIPWKMWGSGRTKRLEQSKLEKLGQSDERFFGPFTRHFLSQLHSATFLSFLQKLTGVGSLVVDPSLNGCGLHSTGNGGRLMIHTDSNRHPHGRGSLHQALNLILYLNQDWKEEYGGQLELWTRDRRPCKEILPIANRIVVFQSDTGSFHGHPRPVSAPGDRRRNSLSVYYYSVDREIDAHYEGMQKKPRWVPTSRADWEFAARSVQKLDELVTRLHGLRIRFPARLCPFTLPSDAPSHLSLGLVDWPQLDDATRRQLEDMHLRHFVLDGQRGAIAGLLDSNKPVAYLSYFESSNPTDRENVLLLRDNAEGRLYYVHPETGQKTFAGYVNDILKIASCAGHLHC
jgi:hypothetical protein